MVQSRPNSYYFRWALPAILQSIFNQKEVVRSLRTKSIEVACRRGQPFSDMAYQFKEIKDSFLMSSLANQWRLT